MLSAVNAIRAQGGVCGETAFGPAAPLAWDAELELAAILHTQDMAENDHFSHVGTDGSTLGERAESVGYEWVAVGENIARYQSSVSQVIADWMASPSHCRQILDPAFVEMGAAEEDAYWTQVFGLPQ